MAQKIECDRCGEQALGSIVPVAGEVTDRADGGVKPSVKDWAFVRAPRLEGKAWPSNATLLCPGCVFQLTEWLKSQPRLAKHGAGS